MKAALAAGAMLLAVAPAARATPAPVGPAGEVWQVDRIRLTDKADPAALQTLADDHSLAAVADHLRRLGVRFTRGPVSLRVADLPGGLVAQLRALPPGEPFVLSADGGTTVNALRPGASASVAPLWQPALPGEPSAAQLAAARHFLDVAIPPAERDHFFDKVIDGSMGNLIAGIMRAQKLGDTLAAHPALRPVFARFIARQREQALSDMRAHLPQLIEAQTIGYARLFSVDELNQLAGFFGQPLGRKYLRESQLLATQPEIAAWQQGVAARGQARIPGEIQALMTEVRAALDKEKGTNVL